MAQTLNKFLIKVKKFQKYLNIVYWLKFSLSLDNFNLFIFYAIFFSQYYISKKVNLVLVKITLFKISKKKILMKLIINLLDSINVVLI